MAWDTSNNTLPGLYVQIVQAAQAQLVGGTVGTVAIPLETYDTAKATAQTFYTITTEQQAIDQFGADNIAPINLALKGGCKQVLVYTLQKIDGATITEQVAYDDARAELDTQLFDVFAYADDVSDAEKNACVTWVKNNRLEGKHFVAVLGGTATEDADPTVGNTRSTTLKDDYVINVINGAVLEGVTYCSQKFTPYVAGLVAACALNASITYSVVEGASDVNKRLTRSQQKDALVAGSLVLVNDGEKVKVLQGIVTSGLKIRAIKLRITLQTDLVSQVANNYIGKITNDVDGQNFLISMIKLYMEQLEKQEVLTNIVAGLDPSQDSTGDAVFVQIGYTEIDSMERIFLTINI